MKLQKIIIVILIIGLIGCSKKNNEIIINGKTIGNIPDKIEYTVPINGTWFYGAKKSIVPDSLGNFTISLKSDLASFVTLYVPKQASAVLLVEPGSEYGINFHLNSKSRKIEIRGESSEAQTLYNSFSLPEFRTLSMSNELLKDSVLKSISFKINNIKKEEISQFRKLLEKQKITKNFYDLAIIDRKCYYSALEAEIISLKYNIQLNSQEEQNAKVINIWKENFEQTLMTDSLCIRSPWSYALNTEYIRFKQYTSETFKFDELKKIYEQGKIHSSDINEAKKHINEKKLEYYYASYIISNSHASKDNSKELITLYENFKKEYPNSNYINYLTASLKPIIDFHNKIELSNINKKIKLVENYENIDTFNELIKTLKGKKVFVDIWGTWCGPCKREFQQKDKYAEILKSNNITTLYICEGRVSKEKVWKEMINFYDLEGQHILANKKLLADIISKFGNNGNFAYPWYLLVDENGNVVNKRASYPSKKEQLEKEINENYVW